MSESRTDVDESEDEGDDWGDDSNGSYADDAEHDT